MEINQVVDENGSAEKVDHDCKRISPLRGRFEAWRDVVDIGSTKEDNKTHDDVDNEILTGGRRVRITHGSPGRLD